MWHCLLDLWRSAAVRTRPQTARPRGPRPTLEQLEDRLVPSNFTAATVSDLIADINAANLGGGTNTITLVVGKTFTLAAVDNATDGATGLPVIAANDNLTILGNGDTIARSTVTGTPAFRLLDVAGGASLNLANLTLQGGLAFGSGVSADGGGIYNQGTLDLNGVTVQNNTAQGQNGAAGSGTAGHPGQSAAGGGIWSNAALTLENGSKVQSNQALGGIGGGGGIVVIRGRFGLLWYPFAGGKGGDANGGGLYVNGGTATLTGVTLSSNTALGGQGGNGAGGAGWGIRSSAPGGNGGNGFGGALATGGGTVTLLSDMVDSNSAQGGRGGSGGQSRNPGFGEGGGLYIDPAATVDLDAFTLANILNNTASTSDPNIHGSYGLLH
jgi:hypothetical protein